MIPRLEFFDKYRDYGALFIRLVVGFHLVYGTQDNVFSYARMEEFAEFLGARGVPFPLFAAFLSAYAQFVCGILFVVGAFTRPAALVMVINFVAALFIAHRSDAYPAKFPALMMLSAALFLLLHGAGRPSFDERSRGRRGRR
ncbi:MAG TPA: DoxX family protein [Pyrinomonadaceae bacterium]|nr:DoxX family protein [Pyrinomonadaceae bacterium]